VKSAAIGASVKDARLVARVHARIRRELGDEVFLRYLAAMAASEPRIRRRLQGATVESVLGAIAHLER